MPRPLALRIALCAALASSCQRPAVAAQLVFPSEQTFLATNTATLDVFDGAGAGDQSPDAICRALSVQSSVAPSGVDVLDSTGSRDVCELRDGAIVLDDIPVGRLVFFASAIDFSGTAILRGCRVVDVFGDDNDALSGQQREVGDALDVTDVIDVQLAILPTYPDAPPACEDVAKKCEERQPCAP